MIYEITFLEKAKKDIDELKRTGNTRLLRKVNILIEELKRHPYTGTGKPEKLKNDLAGYWSRRISQEHRLVYSVTENIATVIIVSVKGHYIFRI
jgi:toxin YoeB